MARLESAGEMGAAAASLSPAASRAAAARPKAQHHWTTPPSAPQRPRSLLPLEAIGPHFPSRNQHINPRNLLTFLSLN